MVLARRFSLAYHLVNLRKSVELPFRVAWFRAALHDLATFPDRFRFHLDQLKTIKHHQVVASHGSVEQILHKHQCSRLLVLLYSKYQPERRKHCIVITLSDISMLSN